MFKAYLKLLLIFVFLILSICILLFYFGFHWQYPIDTLIQFLLVLLLSVPIFLDRHYRAVKRMPYGISLETLGVYHTRTVGLAEDCETAYGLCLVSIKQFYPYETIRMDSEKGEIRVITSRDESVKPIERVLCHINISILQIENISHITITSYPSGWLTLVDYGHSLRNVEEAVRSLREHANVLEVSGNQNCPLH